MSEGHGLYSRGEIMRMTYDALRELLEYYRDTANAVGVKRVEDELNMRAAVVLEQDAAEEAAWQAEEDRQQAMHDEMINDMLANDGRWG